jgi:hypothetical protein
MITLVLLQIQLVIFFLIPCYHTRHLKQIRWNKLLCCFWHGSNSRFFYDGKSYLVQFKIMWARPKHFVPSPDQSVLVQSCRKDSAITQILLIGPLSIPCTNSIFASILYLWLVLHPYLWETRSLWKMNRSLTWHSLAIWTGVPSFLDFFRL